MRRIAIYLLCIFMLLPVATMTAQPGYNYSKLQREKLNRGVVAIRENPSEVIVSWRYLSSDPIQTGFNVYRDGKKLTDTPITVSTLFRDKNNSQKTAVYEVRPVLKGKETHHIDKIVRSAVRMPVSQDDDRAQPTSAVRRGKIDRIGLGKIVMPVSFLILRVTRQNPFLKETRGDAVGIEHGTAPIVAHIEYQSFAFLEMRKHIIEVVFTHAT